MATPSLPLLCKLRIQMIPQPPEVLNIRREFSDSLSGNVSFDATMKRSGKEPFVACIKKKRIE
jgi:hypothetical protein